MRYDKLVRDKIPEIIKRDGGKPITHIAGPDELAVMLVNKLYEEVGEFSESWTLEKLADVAEVILKLSEVIGANPEQLELVRQKKVWERGGFSKNIFLEEA